MAIYVNLLAIVLLAVVGVGLFVLILWLIIFRREVTVWVKIFLNNQKIKRLVAEIARKEQILAKKERLIAEVSPEVDKAEKLVRNLKVSYGRLECLAEELKSADPAETLLLVMQYEDERKSFDQLKGEIKVINSRVRERLAQG